MIVRINQFDVHHAEHQSGWDSDGPGGPIACAWPDDAFAYEILILESDEQKQPLARGFRQMQLRQLIPDVLEGFREDGEEIVARLDGPAVDGELADAFKYLAEQDGYGRFAFPGVQKLEAEADPPVLSVRFHAQPRRLAAMCADLNVGLDRSVRLRALALPPEMVNSFLDVERPDDERWERILSRAGVMMSTTRGLNALQLITRRFDPAAARQRLTRRLQASAQDR